MSLLANSTHRLGCLVLGHRLSHWLCIICLTELFHNSFLVQLLKVQLQDQHRPTSHTTLAINFDSVISTRCAMVDGRPHVSASMLAGVQMHCNFPFPP